MAKKKQYSLIQDSMTDRIIIGLIYTFLVLLSIIIMVPLIYVVSASFSDPQAVVSSEVWLWPVRPTLRGYKAVFENAKILSGFGNSFFYMIVGTLVNIVMTVLCAFPLSRREFTQRNKISAMCVFTMYFSGGLVPSYMLVNSLGLIDTRWAIIIPSAMSTWNMIICRTYFVNTIPDELYEASQLDGCTPIKFLISVAAPLSKSILAVLILYYGVARWNSYFDAMVYLKSANLMPLQIILREILVLNQIDFTQVTDPAAIASMRGLADLLKFSTIVVASLPVLCIYPFVQKYFVKGVMVGAVKA